MAMQGILLAIWVPMQKGLIQFHYQTCSNTSNQSSRSQIINIKALAQSIRISLVVAIEWLKLDQSTNPYTAKDKYPKARPYDGNEFNP